MKNRNVITYAGGGGSPEQSQRVVFGRQLDENYSQTSARQAKPRFRLQARALAFSAKGGKPAEPVLSKQSVLADAVKSNVKDGAPAPVRASETGWARNWTMPPLRLERECKEHSAEQNDLLSFCERRNSATIDNRCVEFDRRESTESTAIIGLRALGRRIAFTMAEILLSLTIIGVVAAITLPSLTGNINERTWSTQRKALYARMSQAISLMPALNGYGTLTEGDSSTSAVDTAAETFVTAGLSKVLKINNICDNEHLEDCGIASKIITYNGSTMSMPATMHQLNGIFSKELNSGYPYSQIDTKAAAFETANGESVVAFYYPYCRNSLQSSGAFDVQSRMCVNFIYDLNGNKGPNTVGKDIGFMSVLYPSDSFVVAPNLAASKIGGGTYESASTYCKSIDNEARVPNREELASMFYNQYLLGITPNGGTVVWSSSLLVSNGSVKAWTLGFDTGYFKEYLKTESKKILCVKR